jgi:hypothetical protein
MGFIYMGLVEKPNGAWFYLVVLKPHKLEVGIWPAMFERVNKPLV